MWQRVLSSKAPAAVVQIRLMVGAVFLSEGLQKFMFPDQLGAGRFAKIGLPSRSCSVPWLARSRLCAAASSCLGSRHDLR